MQELEQRRSSCRECLNKESEIYDFIWLATYVDHALVGDWLSLRDCHIKPDLLLIYRIHDRKLQLARIGSHSDLF
ncbi:type II toxin-antitoxin system YafQ family toxin [Endozoicomonas sp. GU-1]|uniref:type II toxin-antitoxin system YafQ family toxin n=1 Tax=Endozoicomonas sp. GU-1 TaxID=3009078 RepID=UPI0022B2BD84|nr:type II toxin-antitoxin system YafQ family toxin [Endozoicomonas sp. GU-1]WBA80130.1 type II toxin-antitoxin system YafQ family toxin [Endozoicomonas sp. GU-1]WBA87704.1 type II toxin-antitoxin system YafQ family toxin [Endozoicomonas sp. GU-1]